MKVIETENQFILQSEDSNGTFEFRIHKNCRQIQLETEMNTNFPHEAYVDSDYIELSEIRDMINKVLKIHKK
ncbi:MAG: hypothetical protein LBP63_01955 [Prevotellaceae bacterium]|jgi:hypothetical protein|nr:hypothetical protein [Prevotellaceae bacterium]